MSTALRCVALDPCVHVRRTMHDQELPINVQCTSVRLMLNLVEVLVARSKNTGDRSVIEQHRQLLQQMLVTHLAKLTTLERQVPKLIAAGLHDCLFHAQVMPG